MSGVRSVLKTIFNNESNQGQVIFRLLVSILFKIYKMLPFRKAFAVKLGSGAKYFIDPDVPNSAGVVYTRTYEHFAMEVARNYIVNATTMVDVGAHTGLYSLQLADIFNKFILFEPAAETYRVLERNFHLNPHLIMSLHNLALGDISGEGSLRKQCSYDGMAAIVPGNGDDVNETLVAIETLDSFCGDIDVGFLKIDVEGYELNVLRGATCLLRNNPKILVHVEITKNFDEVLAIFRDLNFGVAYLDQDGSLVAVSSPESANIANASFYTEAARGDFWALGPEIKHSIQHL